MHPITAEDHAVALIRFESGAVGQFEVSWAFRGGMDLRDEVAGTEGTIDGYVVNAIVDACFASSDTGKWEPVTLDDWRGGTTPRISRTAETHEGR